PNVVGLRIDIARAVVEMAGFAVGSVAPSADGKGPPLVVQNQFPSAGLPLSPGGAVNLLDVPLPSNPGVFLTDEGEPFEADDDESSAAYYAAVDPCAERTTFDDWRRSNHFGESGDEVSAIYENHNDMDFGRQLHMLQNTH